MLGANTRTWDNLPETSFLGRMAVRGATQQEWSNLLVGSNDDAGVRTRPRYLSLLYPAEPSLPVDDPLIVEGVYICSTSLAWPLSRGQDGRLQGQVRPR